MARNNLLNRMHSVFSHRACPITKRKNNISFIGGYQEELGTEGNHRFPAVQKGISLSIETVIVLILAVLVLVAVLFFFMSGGNKPMNEISARFEQNKWCTAYTQIDPECKTAEFDSNVKKGIANACSKLQYPDCTEGTESTYMCTLRCCGSYCSGGSSCKTDAECEYCDTQKKEVHYSKCINGVCKKGAYGGDTGRKC